MKPPSLRSILFVLGLCLGYYAYALDIIPAPSSVTGGPPTGSAGGDLTGTYPNPTLNATQPNVQTLSAGQITVVSTLTVSGNAFSVGGSSFSVAGGSATVAYRMTAGAFSGSASGLTGLPFVNASDTFTYTTRSNTLTGSSNTFTNTVSFGNGGTLQSTFTSTGNLQLVSGAAITSAGSLSLSTAPSQSLMGTVNLKLNTDGSITATYGPTTMTWAANGGLGIGITSPVAPSNAIIDVIPGANSSGNKAFCAHDPGIACGGNGSNIYITHSNSSDRQAIISQGNNGLNIAALDTNAINARSINIQTSGFCMSSGGCLPTGSNMFQIGVSSFVAGSTYTATALPFSVGASTFVVSGGSVGVNTVVPGTLLDISSGVVTIEGVGAALNVSTLPLTAGNVFQVSGTTAVVLAVANNQHLESGSGPTPGKGAGCATITGNDVAGTITLNAATTVCTITFTRPYTNTPRCFLEDTTGVFAAQATPTTTTLAFTVSVGNSDSINYFCIGRQ